MVWHYTSNQRFYALTLQPTGWVLSKRTPPTRATALSRVREDTGVQRGRLHTVGVVQVGDQMTVSADGHLLAQFTDTQRPYMTGAFGLYSEDAQARFGHVRLLRLPAPPQASRSDRSPPLGHSFRKEPRFQWPSVAGSAERHGHSPRRRIMVIYGTRPEAVKVAPS